MKPVDNFRSAHEASEWAATGNVATEELRIALVHYRKLFSDQFGVAMTGDDHVDAA